MYTIQDMSANENPSPDAMLDSISALIREFLVCDDHQLTVLTLWALHTWCYGIFPTTPYLHIHSPEPECGKTTCLQLLKVLSSSPWISSGPDPAALMQRLVAYEEEKRKTEARNQANPDHLQPPPANPKPSKSYCSMTITTPSAQANVSRS